MFILKRQDVEISSVQHPKTGQQVPILNYQGQTFRLIQVFNAQQAEEARAFWRDLTDNRGKACVLLEEPERYSVWGKVRLDQLSDDGQGAGVAVAPAFIQASLLLLQAVFFDIEDLLGSRQAGSFEKEIAQVFQQWNFPPSHFTRCRRSASQNRSADESADACLAGTSSQYPAARTASFRERVFW